MDNSKKFSCFILGEGTLPIQCAQVLVDREHIIYGIISSNQAVINWARDREIPSIDPRDKDIVTFLSQRPFDYLFSIVNPYILPKLALELPRRCAINYHNAPLPRYAGSNVTSWAIMQGERVYGATWHAMAELVDAGDIFKQCLFEVDERETALTLDAKCYDAALSSFTELIDDIACDHVSARAQNLSERTFFLRNKRPSSACMLFWNRSVQEISAFVRALDFGPYENPMGLPKLAIGKDFIIVSEVEVLDSISTVPPGTITHIDPEFVRVSAIDGEIALRKLLTIDGQPLSIPDFAAKFGLNEGYQFKELDQGVADRITAYYASICQHETFWTKQLETLEKFTLPYERRKTLQIQHARNSCIPMTVPREILNLLEKRYVRWRIEEFLQAAFVAYLSRIGGVESFDIGYSDIELKSDLADLEGIFAENVPLHMFIEHEKSFEEIFYVVQEQVKLAKQRKTYARDIMARYPALRSKANLQEYLPSVFVELLETLHDYKVPHGSELTLVIQENGIECFWFYNEEVFEEESIVEMQHGFTTFLQSIMSDPQRPISHLPLLTNAERDHLLVEWNTAKSEYPLEQCLHQLFEAQVERIPEAIAVVYEDEQLSYQELNAHVNRLAHQLREHGVGPERLVVLLAERGIPFLVSILAVFKAGGAYLPLDPHHPPARLRQVIELSRCTLVLATTAFAPTLTYVLKEVSAEHSPESLYYEEVLQASQNEENLPVYSRPRDLAYVIYTSGSTGQPKGAMVEQRGMVNHIYAKIEALTLTNHDKVAQTASQCFVISVWQLLAALLVGGSVQIYPDEVAHHPVQLLTQVEHHQISILEIVPSLMRAMLEADEIKAACLPKLEALRWVIPTGEALPVELCRRWLHSYPHVPLLNAYGSSECSDDVAHFPIYEAPEEMRSSVPIGRVIPNMQFYVLDRHLEPLPIGVSGELYVGGIGVGRGYLGDEQRTKEAFVADPFGLENGARLYKSGDLVRYLSNGNLEFLGRLDHQVKIRGVRIELGEIEVVLIQHPGVEQAVVVAREDALNDKRLVAYIVPHQGQSVSVGNLRSHVMKELPSYMVPSTFVLVETLPLTSNGKVDRRALPIPEYNSQGLESSFAMPQTPLQETIAASWAQVLGIAQIGIHDNFFALGGHSLLAMQVLSRLRRALQVELPLHRFFAAPTIAELSQFIEQMKASKALLHLSAPYPLSREKYRMKLSSLLPTQDGSGSRGAHQGSIQINSWLLGNVSGEEDVHIFPASFFQESLWLHDQLEPNRAIYNISSCFRLRGLLNSSVLEQVLNAIVQRHEILRTTFLVFEGKLVQVISPTQFIPLQMLDLRHLPQAEQEAESLRLATAEAQRPFDLTRGPLLRTSLLQLAAEEYMLLLTIHHIISDEWSRGVLCQELVALYTAFLHDEPSSLPELPIQYADFAVWQRQWLQDEVLATQLSYWRQQLSGAPALLELPTDHPRPAVQTFRGAQHSFVLSQELADALKMLSRGKGVTLFMTVLAAFKVLLCRYTGQTDMVVGSPIADRNRSGTEGLIGFFLNMLVLRTNLSENPSFEEVLRRVGEVALGSYAHQDVPFEKLVQEIKPERTMSYHPLFQVMFTLQSNPTLAFDLPGLHLQLVEVENETAKFDLSLILKDTGQELIGTWEYSTDLFDSATISRMTGHFQTLLEGIVANPEQLISDLPLLTAAERQQLLVDWNATQTPYPKDQCIHHLFEEQVERTPEAVAVVFENQQLTYQQLNRRANQLAHHLQGLGVGPDMLVGLYVERSLDMVVGVLGILKAGGVYVPLDPTYPQDRLSFMLQDSQTTVVLTQQRLKEKLSKYHIRIVCLDTGWEIITQEPSENPRSNVVTDNLAYVIYTSGSTGKPKGVLITHGSIVDHCYTIKKYYELDPSDRVLQFSPITFDASLEQILPTLIAGAGLILRGTEVWSTTDFYKKMQEFGLTIFHLTPAYWHLLTQEWTNASGFTLHNQLRLVVVGGDRMLPKYVDLWNRLPMDSVHLLNSYGPTETTITATLFEIPRQFYKDLTFENMPIGRPLPNRTIYILDTHGNSVPIGVPGELYIGGKLLARGYLHRPELTAEKFIPDPFSKEPNARLYRTGDLVRYLPDGNIEFLGRADHQVKVSGYRIELGEIEFMLMQLSSVQEAVVVTHEDILGDKRLVAYIIPHQGQTVYVSDLRRHVMNQLPTYMVPSVFVLVEAFPLTPNGKVDRCALPKVEGLRAELETAFVAPQTERERTIVAIWQEVLGIKKVGIHDNFFDLGGNSLLLAQVNSKLQTILKRKITLLELFEYPTVSSLVEHLNPAQSAPSSPQRNVGRAEVRRESMRLQQQIRQKRHKM